MSRQRLDKLLVQRGLFESRQKAQAAIMAGQVFVEGQRVDKAGALVPEEARVEVRGPVCPYVSRGGLKLEAAIEAFGISVAGKRALDVGASTGGFTDCLLKRGAARVYAVDVGYGQLHWRLRQDPRVVVLERTNARYLRLKDLGELVDLAVIDVSFISLTKIIPAVKKLVVPGGDIIALIKPQFEVGRGEVGRGGVVKDPQKHRKVISRLQDFFAAEGLEDKGLIPSPILGPKGNREFLIWLKVPA
ncbi:TlyA family RNA methyltransferase [Thermosulfuriphilus ammonigenes]|uniref:TlyA family RNA methyltransferase n=1 Tax=Thermosulfuriphilus ammonigenes TaxID=1936021 RepID=A0A6G7PUB0_9BACT|nr:23S rRNA (cytidine1920-2'-O)/16S rRNA (cytidine1409-2'-O)-methyltransferase [Thermosulfuriphilus ammonigenes]QIJ71269.1 TlyA family RNA methyltransferase [Thermosulfuriphilus ammonigenes]